jgi:hypothetical protein
VQLMKDSFAAFPVSSHVMNMCLIRHVKCIAFYPVFESCFVGEGQAVLFSKWFFFIKLSCVEN